VALEPSFFSSSLAPWSFFYPFFYPVDVDVEGGGVVSPKDMKGYSMASGLGWFEPLPDLHVREFYNFRG
jgi:hypothetical protein